MPSQAVTVALHVVPRASRDEVCGLRTAEDGSCEVELRVSAAPDKGAANKAVCKLLAKDLGLAKSMVVLVRGESSRHKLVRVDAAPALVEAWMGSLPAL